ncbi:MAG TPA: glycosyltransferase family 2 protein [Elusimicrobiota bacterium]|nr:glycosyltransferase family 2 protein [Elusimicrobiota bacterium]
MSKSKKIKKLQALMSLKQSTMTRTEDPVLVVVPHVPAPDVFPEDKQIDLLIRSLRKTHRVVIMAHHPAPLEEKYRRLMMMEGVEIADGARIHLDERSSPVAKEKMHETPFKAVFICTQPMVDLYLRDLTLFSPTTPFVVFFPHMNHLKTIRAEQNRMARVNAKNRIAEMYRLASRIMVSNRHDADALQQEVSPYFHPDVFPSNVDTVLSPWLKGLIKALPAHKVSPVTVQKKLTSIIILCHDDLSFLKNCVESIRKNTNVPYELIFVDNASKDGTDKYLRTVKDAKIISNPENLAFARGNNQGVMVASGDRILMLNADVIVTPHWLEYLNRCMDSHPLVGLVGPSTNCATQIQSIPAGYTSLKDLDKFAMANSIKNSAIWEETHRLIGFCLLIRKEVIQKVGLLDERFGPGGYEDYDYCLRVRQAGFKIMHCKDVYIHHFGGKGYQKMNYDRLRETNRGIFVDKWCQKSLEFLETTGF